MPRKSPREKPVNVSLVIEGGRSVISKPMPRSAVNVAKVMIKGGQAKFGDPKTVEGADAKAQEKRNEDGGPNRNPCVSSQATMTLVKPTTAPTEGRCRR